MSTNELTEKELDEIQQKIAAKNAPESAEAFKILEELIRADIEKKYTAKLEGEAQKLADKKITAMTRNSLLERQKQLDQSILKSFEIQSEIIKTLKEQAEQLKNLLKIIEISNEEIKTLRKIIEKNLHESNRFAI